MLYLVLSVAFPVRKGGYEVLNSHSPHSTLRHTSSSGRVGRFPSHCQMSIFILNSRHKEDSEQPTLYSSQGRSPTPVTQHFQGMCVLCKHPASVVCFVLENSEI